MERVYIYKRENYDTIIELHNEYNMESYNYKYNMSTYVYFDRGTNSFHCDTRINPKPGYVCPTNPDMCAARHDKTYSVHSRLVYLLNEEIKNKTVSWGQDGANYVALLDGQPFLNIINGKICSLVLRRLTKLLKRFYIYLPDYVKHLYLPEVTQCWDYSETNLQSIYMPKCTEIEDDFCRDAPYLKFISIPKCQHIGRNAFRNTPNIKDFYAPECINLGEHVLEQARSLLSLRIPKCTHIHLSACGEAINLRLLDAPNCQAIHNSAFYNVPELVSVNIPRCEVISANAFRHAQKITTLNLPKCKEIDSEVFHESPKLTRCDIPACESIGNNSFHDAINMTKLNAPECKTIGGNSFYNVPNLRSVYLDKCESFGTDSFDNISDNMTFAYLDKALQDYNKNPSDLHIVKKFKKSKNVRFVDKHGNEVFPSPVVNITVNIFNSMASKMMQH